MVVTGVASVDALAVQERPELADYVRAVSEYVVHSPTLTAGQAKKAQLALSSALGRALGHDLEGAIVRIAPERAKGLHLHAGERSVAGALRSARADVSES